MSQSNVNRLAISLKTLDNSQCYKTVFIFFFTVTNTYNNNILEFLIMKIGIMKIQNKIKVGLRV